MAGKEASKKRGKGRNRRDDLHNYWKQKAPALVPGSYQWRINAWADDAGRGKRKLRLDPIATGLSWEDRVIQTATLDVQNPEQDESLRLLEGHRVQVLWRNGNEGKWHELWDDMRITSVATALEGGTKTLELADPLEWLKRSRDDFLYKKGDKKGPHKRVGGWLCHEIAADICHRYGIKVGRLAKGTFRITNLTKNNVSPLSVLKEAYKQERDETGQRFVIRMRKGALYVTPLRRSNELLVLGGQILGGEYRRGLKEDLATELTVRASVKRKKGKHKKITVTVRAGKKIRQRFGHVHRTWEIEDTISSGAAARKRARRRLAEQSEPEREVTISLPGVPTLRRGDAVQIQLATEGLKELMYVKTATHTVSGGDYTTDLTLTFSDPYRDKEGDKIREKICKEAKDKGHRPPDYCQGARVDKDYDPAAPKNKKRRNRGDSHHKKNKPKKKAKAKE